MVYARAGRRSPSLVARDRELVRLVLAERAQITLDELRAFSDMNPAQLSHKQRAWIEATLAKLDVVAPPENLVSSGLVPKERTIVETPEALRKLPLRPPTKPQVWRER